MTDAPETSAQPEAYVGFDFGTSNSSLSFVDQQSVRVYKKRSEERQWRDLSDLVDVLPYPLAAPLARYLGQTELARLVEGALDFVEAALAVAAYVAYIEFCSLKGRASTKLFKGFTQRSPGPLWHFLRDCVAQLGQKGAIGGPFRSLLITPELFNQVDAAVTARDKLTHKKIAHAAVDHVRPVSILANLHHQVFSSSLFGFFEKVQRQRFEKQFRGVLRLANGRQPFVKTLIYEGEAAFSDGDPVLVQPESARVLSLLPLIFWDACDKHPDLDPPGHCFIYDAPSRTGAEFSYKAAGYLCSREISTSGPYKALALQLLQMREADPSIEYTPGRFHER